LNRREKRCARTYALKMAYAHSMTLDSNDLHKKIRIENDDFEDMSQIIEYATEIVDIYMKNTEKLDKLISSKSSNWDISRMALIDRLIIKLALSEIFYFDEVPGKVSIVEAVEISKEYSTEDSSRFINGILDSIYNDKKLKKII
jgi:N utilization substance protein B